MKILTKKKQQYLMAYLFKAQKAVQRNDFCEATNQLANIAGVVLTLEQLIILRDELSKRANVEVKDE